MTEHECHESPTSSPGLLEWRRTDCGAVLLASSALRAAPGDETPAPIDGEVPKRADQVAADLGPPLEGEAGDPVSFLNSFSNFRNGGFANGGFGNFRNGGFGNGSFGNFRNY